MKARQARTSKQVSGLCTWYGKFRHVDGPFRVPFTETCRLFGSVQFPQLCSAVTTSAEMSFLSGYPTLDIERISSASSTVISVVDSRSCRAEEQRNVP